VVADKKNTNQQACQKNRNDFSFHAKQF